MKKDDKLVNVIMLLTKITTKQTAAISRFYLHQMTKEPEHQRKFVEHMNVINSQQEELLKLLEDHEK